MKFRRLTCLALLVFLATTTASYALDKQPSSVYHARRVALSVSLKGGVAVLFAAPEAALDFDPYRQDSDFYYLTGWNEPGAALLIVADAPQADPPRTYREILFLPTRDFRMEKYTGPKMDAATPGAARLAEIDAVASMTELPATMNSLIGADRRLAHNLWAEPGNLPSQALFAFTAATLGLDAAPSALDVSAKIMPLRQVKDDGEIALLRKASPSWRSGS
jgi:Xaa-Pro aminopeptidase